MEKCFLFVIVVVVAGVFFSCNNNDGIYDLSKYGLKPDTKENSSALVVEALKKIKEEQALKTKEDGVIVITLPKGRYDFHPEGSAQCTYYISNHDQDNPKSVAFPFEGFRHLIFDARGSEFVFHGRMLPVSIVDSEGCTFKNFSIDFENPHIAQAKVVENDSIEGGITFELAPWVQYALRDSTLYFKGEGWEATSQYGIAFDGATKRLVYQTGDVHMVSQGIAELSPRRLKACHWHDNRLVSGTVLAMRTGGRPAPGIFMYHANNTLLENIKVHYAEGMGLLAQMCEDVSLNGFSVCLKGDDDPRYFTTQADATHFSGCKGHISSIGGLYEGMMDDAINVHGTYLRIVEILDNWTVVGQYMHPQSYGFEWGRVGDTVQFIASNTMETFEKTNCIEEIAAVDKPDYNGAKRFQIKLKLPIDTACFKMEESYGIENLTWSPDVYFARNVIRNNRARGSLFSTPRRTIVEENVFDHTSGTAILLCGDCNGWFETGACHDVQIRNNQFVNSLTNMFQFTEAIISIYPEIPDLKSQKKYFHSHIVVENNLFKTFDKPIVYAKSVDGLVIRNNVIEQNEDYAAFHHNKYRFYFQRVRNDQVRDNKFINSEYDFRKDLVKGSD